MVSADPRASSLTPDFRASSVLPWALQQGLPHALAPQVFRGGPGFGTDLAQLTDEAGNSLTDEAGNALA